MRKLIALGLISFLSFGQIQAIASTPKVGTPCVRANQIQESKPTFLICTIVDGKRVWRKTTIDEKSRYLNQKKQTTKTEKQKAVKELDSILLSLQKLSSSFKPEGNAVNEPSISEVSGTFTIGYQGPLTGPEATIGISQVNAVKYAIKVFMAAHPKIKIELVSIDDQGDPAVAQYAAPTAAKNLKLLGVIGPAYSGSTRISFPFYKEAGIPMISPSATNPDLTDPNSTLYAGEIFHRVGSFGIKEGFALAELSVMKVTDPKVFLIDDSNPNVTYVSKFTIARLKSFTNTEIVGHQIFDNSIDYFKLVESIKKSSANVVVFTGYTYGADLLRQLRKAGIQSIFVMGNNSYTDTQLNLSKIEHGDGIRILGSAELKLVDPMGAANFKKLIGFDPGIFAVDTIDATNVFLNGISSGSITRASMLQHIKKYKGKSIRGTEMSFDLFGDLNQNSFVGYEYIDAGLKVLIKSF